MQTGILMCVDSTSNGTTQEHSNFIPTKVQKLSASLQQRYLHSTATRTNGSKIKTEANKGMEEKHHRHILPSFVQFKKLKNNTET